MTYVEFNASIKILIFGGDNFNIGIAKPFTPIFSISNGSVGHGAIRYDFGRFVLQ